MKNRRSKQTEERLPVKVSYLALHGAEARLAQAVELLLKSAVMNDTQYQGNTDAGKEEPSHQGTAKDVLTNGKQTIGESGKADGKR